MFSPKLGSSAKVDLGLACRISSGKTVTLDCANSAPQVSCLSPKYASQRVLFSSAVEVFFLSYSFSFPEGSRLLECK